MQWREEIVQLHEFFEGWFLGTEGSLDRLEEALAPGFTMVDPNGTANDRRGTIELVRSAHGHTSTLEIRTSDSRLLADYDGVLVTEYVEHHRLSDRSNTRITTAVFVADAVAPNGVAWLRVHETWLDRRGHDLQSSSSSGRE